jgi:hypothetical protein
VQKVQTTICIHDKFVGFAKYTLDFDARNVHEDSKDLVENGKTTLKNLVENGRMRQKDLVGNG